MRTDHFDRPGYARNEIADWWRHTGRSRGRTLVWIHGLDGWTYSTPVYAVTDDFGNLVPVPANH